jgi:hypothetical protein
VRGLGGFCRPNPFPGTAYGTSAGVGMCRTRQDTISEPIKIIHRRAPDKEATVETSGRGRPG